MPNLGIQIELGLTSSSFHTESAVCSADWPLRPPFFLTFPSVPFCLAPTWPIQASCLPPSTFDACNVDTLCALWHWSHTCHLDWCIRQIESRVCLLLHIFERRHGKSNMLVPHSECGHLHHLHKFDTSLVWRTFFSAWLQPSWLRQTDCARVQMKSLVFLESGLWFVHKNAIVPVPVKTAKWWSFLLFICSLDLDALDFS